MFIFMVQLHYVRRGRGRGKFCLTWLLSIVFGSWVERREKRGLESWCIEWWSPRRWRCVDPEASASTVSTLATFPCAWSS